MKKICKFTLTSFIIMIILMAFLVVLTSNKHSEEKSKLGVTNAGTIAKTYIKDADITFETPNNYSRFFADTKNVYVKNLMKSVGTIFITSDNGAVEYHVFVNNISDFIVNYKKLADATDEELAKFSETVMSDIFTENNYKVDVELIQQSSVKVGDIPYLTCDYFYYDPKFREFNYTHSYYTVSNGKLIQFECCLLSDKKFKDNFDFNSFDLTVEDFMSTVVLGNHVKGAGNTEGFASYIKNFSFSLFILLIPLVFYVLKNMTIAKDEGVFIEDSLSLKHSKEILGVLSIVIVMHHICQRVGGPNAGILEVLEYVGVCCVGVFFFFSGYGLDFSRRNKKNYLNKFFRKRLPSIVVPATIVNLIFLAFYLIEGEDITSVDVILYLLGIKLLNSHMWYIVEIIILYAFFAISFKLIKNEVLAYAVNGLFTLAITVGGLFLGHGEYWFQGEWWYNTTLLFFVGMIFSRNEKSILEKIKKHFSKFVILLSTLFVILFALSKYMLMHKGYYTDKIMDGALTLLVQLPMVIVFVFLVIVIGLKVKISNPVLEFLGAISLEVYIIHNLFMNIFGFVAGSGMFAFLVLLTSIVSAFVLHRIIARLFYMFNKKKKPERLIPKWKAYFSELAISTVSRIKAEIVIYKKRPKRTLTILFRNIVCIFLVVLSLYPILLLICNATQKNYITDFSLIPGNNFLNNVNAVNSSFEELGGGLYRGIFNSCVISISSALLCTYFAGMCAYSFETYRYKGKKFFVSVTFAAMFIPVYSSFAGLFILVMKFHMMNNFLPIILTSASSPIAVYFMRMYFKNVKMTEIVEAARIDGLNEFSIFNRIIIPLTKPAFALELIFSFTSSMNNWFPQSNILLEWDKKTAAAYVHLFAGDQSAVVSPECYAIVLFATIPSILIYILCSKSIVSSITLGAVKE